MHLLSMIRIQIPLPMLHPTTDTGNRKTNKHDILSRGKKKKKISPFISSFSVPGLFDQVLQTLNSLHSGLVVAQ